MPIPDRSWLGPGTGALEDLMSLACPGRPRLPAPAKAASPAKRSSDGKKKGIRYTPTITRKNSMYTKYAYVDPEKVDWIPVGAN